MSVEPDLMFYTCINVSLTLTENFGFCTKKNNTKSMYFKKQFGFVCVCVHDQERARGVECARAEIRELFSLLVKFGGNF